MRKRSFTIFFIVVVRTFEVEDGDIEILVLNQGGQGGIACFGFYGRMLGVVTLEVLGVDQQLGADAFQACFADVALVRGIADRR